MSESINLGHRKKYIDAVKGFCLILVLFGHAGGIPYIGGYLSKCDMQVFFVVAGMTYNNRKNETFGQFALKKSKRLLLPYFAYGTVLWLIDCLCRRLSFTEILFGGVGVIYARHCLFLYHGNQNNLFLLDNLNGQLWFLPAIFISYILFWLIVKANKKTRPLIVVGYIIINITTNYLPILLPWSLDTAFITADLMYFGYLMKPCLAHIEKLDIKKFFHLKVISSVILIAGIYLVSTRICGEINTSVRIFGDHGALSVLLYMIIGISGTILYLTGFSIAENTNWLIWICNFFAYLGKHTMVLLASHIAVFKVVESGISMFDLNIGYAETLIEVVLAVVFAVILGAYIEKIGEKHSLIKMLV